MGHAHFYRNLALFCIKFPINLSFTATNKSRKNITVYQIKVKGMLFSKKSMDTLASHQLSSSNSVISDPAPFFPNGQ